MRVLRRGGVGVSRRKSVAVAPVATVAEAVGAEVEGGAGSSVGVAQPDRHKAIIRLRESIRQEVISAKHTRIWKVSQPGIVESKRSGSGPLL